MQDLHPFLYHLHDVIHHLEHTFLVDEYDNPLVGSAQSRTTYNNHVKDGM